jgi:hypothetical protein
MFMSRNSCVICVLALALVLALATPGWAQASKPASPDQVSLYHRAVASLEQAERALQAGNVVEAKSLMRQSNSLFTLLHKESTSLLAERRLSPQEDQQLAINQKLADDTQAQADRLMATAAAQAKLGRELETQRQGEASQASYRESRENYHQAQILSIRALGYALHNQQLLFHDLAQ